MKSLKKIIVLIIILIPIIFISVYSYNLKSVSSQSKEVLFEVPKDSTVYGIGAKLKKEGLIRSEFFYKVYVKLNNIDSYYSGTYSLNTNYSTRKIVKILSNKDKSKGIRITFREGKTIRGVVGDITTSTALKEEDIYEKLKDEAYIDSLINKYWFLTNDIKNKDIYYPLEGYLYPETYDFSYNVTIEDIISKMLDQTNIIFGKYKIDLENNKYGINGIVTIASMIEKEGKTDEDRKLIASVFYNRLSSGMSLGSDVTTYYAVQKNMTESLTTKDINTYNPYNTRGPKMAGKLPVGAICNFSESSLKAALYPTKSDYYYFVADKSGKVHFTKTYNEHLKLIQELKEANNWIG